MKNKYRVMLKIKRIFDSCKTFEQWNIAFNWFCTYIKPRVTFEDYYELKEMINNIHFKIELRHTGAIINPPSKPDNAPISVGGYSW